MAASMMALAFGALYLLMLGRLPLANPDESRYAEIPREMLAHGDWVTPRLNEVPYFEKPPLVYWTVGLFRLLFGGGEMSSRLAPAPATVGEHNQEVYGAIDHAGLRLITCGGTYDAAKHRYLDNVVVFARLAAVHEARGG